MKHFLYVRVGAHLEFGVHVREHEWLRHVLVPLHLRLPSPVQLSELAPLLPVVADDLTINPFLRAAQDLEVHFDHIVRQRVDNGTTGHGLVTGGMLDRLFLQSRGYLIEGFEHGPHGDRQHLTRL